ncbi:mechanosensitive ion channel family protein [Corynebacterium aquilae]|uniref:mechanosensitive ion channel family protein n=1 Tax=Corynebacterium aquilae TaxID=203263 RepID=UPI001473DFB8|nr:mechanosensitive ion channel domain-containing protein [Corynebacterium aquilae]
MQFSSVPGVPSVTVDSAVRGVAIVVVALAVAWLIRWLLPKFLIGVTHRTETSSRVFGQLAWWVVVAIGVGGALTVVFPSIRPVNIIGGLGVVSVAAGIAFQTVLGNMFAGLVILMRQTPMVGDQVKMDEVAGTITDINLSTTTIRTFDGRQVLVPNGTLHSSVVTVQNRHEWIRTSFTVRIRRVEDYERARRIAVEALDGLDAVLSNPAPVAVLRGVEDGIATMEVRFWSGSQQLDTVSALDEAVIAVTTRLASAGVDVGPDNAVVIHHPE